MKCPIDNIDLVMSDRQGIEIDYCPKCRGVWLDRGELDKIIDRSAQDQRQSQPDEQTRYREARSHYEQPHRKRKSFLGEIFDFD